MDAVSRAAVALAIACASSVASADDPPPYRAIPFVEVIGDGGINSPSVLNLSRWPAVDVGGDGLRFRFASDTLVVGTLAERVADPTGLRAASWRVGDPGSGALLDLPGSALATVIADANLDGTLVGAVLVTGTVWHPVSVRAAVWTLSSDDPGGEPEFHLVFDAGGVPECVGEIPDTMLSAVSPITVSGGSAMFAGIGALTGWGDIPDGFMGGISAAGVTIDVKRLPGLIEEGWCAPWTVSEEPRRTIGQCIAWGGVHPPDGWSELWVIGSFREIIEPLYALCIDTEMWDLYGWTWTDQRFLIPHCRGCESPWATDAPPPCVQVSAEDGLFSFVTDLRLSSFAAGDSSVGRPPALAGIIDVRAGHDMVFACASDNCPLAHAAVVMSSSGLTQSEHELFDLHTVLPDGMGAFVASGIARIYARSQLSGDSDVDWVAVGAVGQDFRGEEYHDDRHGCVWLGQLNGTDGAEWCAFDVNDLAIRPSGLVIEAIHDLNARGLAVGVASHFEAGNYSKRLVYLTEAADLNGDLVKDGGDLAALLGCWGQATPECGLADLDRDGSVGGSDLALLIGAWHGGGPGGAACVELTCHGSPWLSPLRRYPYIGMAVEMLGFDSLDEFGSTLRLLQPDSALGLCEVVDAVASAMEGAE